MEPGTLGLEGRDLTTAPTPPGGRCVNCFYAGEGVISLRNLLHKSFFNIFIGFYNIFQLEYISSEIG